jgi:hypothetical protein
MTIRSPLCCGNLLQLLLLDVALDSLNKILHQYKVLTTPQAEAKICPD